MTTLEEPRLPDGAMLRLVVGAGHWAEDIPPVPAGHRVTVSFSSEGAAGEHADALSLLGYDIVGVQPLSMPIEVGVADFLLDQRLLEAHPTYWRSLADQADKAFSLALGPVLSLLGDVLRAHVAHAAR